MSIDNVMCAINRLIELKVDERLAKGREDENDQERRWLIDEQNRKLYLALEGAA